MTIKHAENHEYSQNDFIGIEGDETINSNVIQDLAENINGLAEIATGTDIEGTPGTGHDHDPGYTIPFYESHIIGHTTEPHMVLDGLGSSGIKNIMLNPMNNFLTNTVDFACMKEMRAGASGVGAPISITAYSGGSTTTIIKTNNIETANPLLDFTEQQPMFMTFFGEDYLFQVAREFTDDGTDMWWRLFNPLPSELTSNVAAHLYCTNRATDPDTFILSVPEWANYVNVYVMLKGTIEYFDSNLGNTTSEVQTEASVLGTQLFDVRLVADGKPPTNSVSVIAEGNRDHPRYRKLIYKLADAIKGTDHEFRIEVENVSQNNRYIPIQNYLWLVDYENKGFHPQVRVEFKP